ncbi:MAG: hypothetical protein AVDCRST_MAG85-2335 [uncultured Solirubrobacteraceae bacterium]|uniref:HTTM domain-containing protein n=1 Tax=uncultured Solirubrobacteraceae bacterium TaxID=1162706 RepID=A0A6J4T0T4_9ACTN|nr:MAG: hypothetical protein AVDCRST_MAG85-2335 [uncultured Solirubrobacteraceae bacterium]
MIRPPPALRTPSVPPTRDPEVPSRDRPLTVFAVAFALALLAHQLWWRGVPGADLHGLVVIAAVWVLLRPAAPARVALLAAVEAGAVARDLPTVGDHTLLAAVTALAFAVAFAVAAARTRGVPTAEALWAQLAPFLRVQAVLLYAAAALAKLNTGFLDAATSCAGPLAAELAFFDPSLLGGRWHVGPAIVATIVVEAGLAVLLAVPRTRVPAVVAGAGFHAMLALAGNVPFAAYALVLYVAFLPSSALPSLGVLPRLVAAGVGALWLAATVTGADQATVRELLQPALRVAVAVGLLTFAVAVARRARSGSPAPGRVLRLRPVYAVAAALLLVNAASPYVGLKTEASFAMFSNLQTEPGHWNHVLLPEAVRVFGAQDELVRLEVAGAPSLERRRRAGMLMVRAELERYLRRDPGASATYVLASDPSQRWTSSAATLGTRPLFDRVMNFYDVREGGRGRC